MDFVNDETRLCYERVMRRDIGYAKLVAQWALCHDLKGVSDYLGYWQDQFAPDLPFDLTKVAVGQLSQQIRIALGAGSLPTG
jgi:hypothetical protein